MKKYIFLVHHAEYVEFLSGLRRLGVLHVKFREIAPSEELLRRQQTQKDLRDALSALRHRDVQHHQDGEEWTEQEGIAILYSFQELSDRLESLDQDLKALQKDIDFLKPWGDFSTGLIHQLEEQGLKVHFFICPQKRFQPEWEREFPLRVIKAMPPDIFFVVINRDEEEVAIDAEEIPPPDYSLDELMKQRQDLQQEIDAINAKLDRYAAMGLPALETALHEAEETTELVTVIESTKKEAEEKLMLLEGFVPVDREQKLMDYAGEKEIPFLVARPRPEDAPPVLLKNSAFSRLFEPIGALFSLPSYGELDLTPFFAPFFMLFFGFCLGDAGYGLVLLLGATLYKPRAKDNLKPVLSLAQFLGVATIIFGIVTGTFFGMNLLEDRFESLGNLRNVMLNSDQVFQLALVLGMVQILFGLGLKAVNQTRQFGVAYSIATYGWIVVLLSLLDLAVLKITGGVSFYTVWVGVAMIMLFNDPKAGFFGRLGKGIWELYGITGIFGDLLSYIRLFALGISSAILGYVVNDISLQIRDGIPYLGPVLFVLFLLVGHGLNLLIASLGAFVHPMRLTFVEFYKNAGFSGGGKPYRPLSANKE